MFLLRSLVVVLSLSTACSQDGKSEVEEDFSDLAGQDSKSDYFSYRLKLLGSLTDGDMRRVLYTDTPRFRGFEFAGTAGDEVEVRNRSTQGDALTWVLDSSFRVIAKNDDADDATLDSRITLTLPASPVPGVYYVVFRDYDLESHYFTTTLDVTASGPGPGPDGEWQDRAMQAANQRFRDFATLAPFQIDVATLPAAGAARVAASDRVMETPTAYELVLDGRDFYLIHAIESVQSGIAAVDLIDDTGRWFAHGYSLEADSDLFWSLVESDMTICDCIAPINGMMACTWHDGSVVESSVMICD